MVSVCWKTGGWIENAVSSLNTADKKVKSGAVTGDPPKTPYLILLAAARFCPLVPRPSVRASDGANYGGFDDV